MPTHVSKGPIASKSRSLFRCHCERPQGAWQSLFVLLVFFTNTIGPLPQAQADEFRLPAPGVRVGLSPEYNPPILKGIKVHPDNPFRFDFILDQGDSSVIPAPAALLRKAKLQGGIHNQEQLKQEATKLIKYFLASLTIPEKDLWVNLSPYEKDRIIPNSFGLTEMGRDLLAEDYMLKQITASLIYPEDEIGKKFWKRIYEEAAKKFGTTNIPVNTFNKVWIVPEKAVVYENVKAGTAYVVESKLKVMLEQDYLAGCQANEGLSVKATQSNAVNALGSSIVRQIIIPELTKEVNEDKNFAQLRQVYNSLILATWYKKKIKDSILAQVYSDKNKVAGVQYTSTVIPAKAGIQFKNDVEGLYQEYLKAFKKGAYNYIKEEAIFIPGMPSKEQGILPRKYFSGGTDLAMDTNTFKAVTDAQALPVASSSEVIVQMQASVIDRAMNLGHEEPSFEIWERPVEQRQILLRKMGFSDVNRLRNRLEYLLTEEGQAEWIKERNERLNAQIAAESINLETSDEFQRQEARARIYALKQELGILIFIHPQVVRTIELVDERIKAIVDGIANAGPSGAPKNQAMMSKSTFKGLINKLRSGENLSADELRLFGFKTNKKLFEWVDGIVREKLSKDIKAFRYDPQNMNQGAQSKVYFDDRYPFVAKIIFHDFLDMGDQTTVKSFDLTRQRLGGIVPSFLLDPNGKILGKPGAAVLRVKPVTDEYIRMRSEKFVDDLFQIMRKHLDRGVFNHDWVNIDSLGINKKGELILLDFGIVEDGRKALRRRSRENLLYWDTFHVGIDKLHDTRDALYAIDQKLAEYFEKQLDIRMGIKLFPHGQWVKDMRGSEVSIPLAQALRHFVAENSRNNGEHYVYPFLGGSIDSFITERLRERLNENPAMTAGASAQLARADRAMMAGDVEVVKPLEKETKAIVFDWDGVVQQAVDLILRAEVPFLIKFMFGDHPTDDERQLVVDYKKTNSGNARDQYEWVFQHMRPGKKRGLSKKDGFVLYKSGFEKMAMDAYEGIRENWQERAPLLGSIEKLLQILKKGKIRMDVATNILETVHDFRFGMIENFNYFSQHYGSESKKLEPGEDVKLGALERAYDEVVKSSNGVDVDKKQIVIFEDNANNIRSAVEHEFTAVGIARNPDHARELKNAGASIIIYQDYGNIERILEALKIGDGAQLADRAMVVGQGLKVYNAMQKQKVPFTTFNDNKQFDVAYYEKLKVFVKRIKSKWDAKTRADLRKSILLTKERLGGIVADFFMVNEDTVIQEVAMSLRNILVEEGRKKNFEEVERLLRQFFDLNQEILSRGVINWDLKLENFGVINGNLLLLDIGGLVEIEHVADVDPYRVFVLLVKDVPDTIREIFNENIDRRNLNKREKIVEHFLKAKQEWEHSEKKFQSVDERALLNRLSQELNVQDDAMASGAVLKRQNTGGIDLTPANMNVQVKTGSPTETFGDDKQGIKFHLDPAMLAQLQNAPGFVPVIINVQPMTDLRQFLGIKEKETQNKIA